MPSQRSSGKASRQANRVAVTGMSKRVHNTTAECRPSGRTIVVRSSLTATKICAVKEREAQREADRARNITHEDRRFIKNLRDIPDPYDDDDSWEDDVCMGGLRLKLAMQEKPCQRTLSAQMQTFSKGCVNPIGMTLWGRRRYPDLRKRRDRTQLQVDAFSRQMEKMADVYLDLGVVAAEGDGLAASYSVSEEGIQDKCSMTIVDIFSTSQQELCLVAGDAYLASACTPTVAITIRTLEVYRVAHLRCPRLGIQVFMRACVIFMAWRHANGWEPSSPSPLTCLGRDTPDWRLKNACPPCLYKLEGEPRLEIPLMATIDGNNSLSRFHRRERVDVDSEEEEGAAPSTSKARSALGAWSKDGVDELMKGFSVEAEEGEEEDGCSEQWQNMKEDVTSRAYRMYDETGFFPCLCQHGFVLIVVDMVKSGELSKYGLSIVMHLLKVLGEIALGYDIGCKFGKLVKAHPALKDIACKKGFQALIGAFHGHGHNRLCGLDNLMIYVKGVGLFHRQQAITTYLKHADQFDTYQGLTLGLCNKYRCALEIKATHTSLHNTMQELGVQSRDEFEAWQAKEKAHLCTLSKEPPEETLEMEYYQKLVNLQDAEERVTTILGVEPLFVPVQNAAGYGEAAKATQRRHALELQVKVLFAVQDLEVRLAVAERWAPGDGKWEEVAAMVSSCRYRRALNDLQGLIIVRMFELAKCNMSGTGYKLCKHIAKALQARSKAVKNAIERYNEQAAAMDPPKPTVDWDEAWSTHSLRTLTSCAKEGGHSRGAMGATRWSSRHGSTLQAPLHRRKIVRLNLEIRRLVTYMVDEEVFLSREEERLRAVGKEGLAVQLSKVPGFTGSILPSISICRERHMPVARPDDVEMHVASPLAPSEEDGVAPPDDEEEEAESDDDDGALADAFLNILRIARDGDREVGDT
ncbi:hypothetical protein B0H13DRAFT_2349171 [Mycena leptocephala]|nr:hypothetical protein B0H13DRAFT_2349171 [Mycena leptocephala]